MPSGSKWNRQYGMVQECCSTDLLSLMGPKTVSLFFQFHVVERPASYIQQDNRQLYTAQSVCRQSHGRGIKYSVSLYLDHGSLLYTLDFLLMTAAAATLASPVPVIHRRPRPSPFLLLCRPCSRRYLYPPRCCPCICRSIIQLPPQAAPDCTPPLPLRPPFLLSAAALGCTRSSPLLRPHPR